MKVEIKEVTRVGDTDRMLQVQLSMEDRSFLGEMVISLNDLADLQKALDEYFSENGYE